MPSDSPYLASPPQLFCKHCGQPITDMKNYYAVEFRGGTFYYCSEAHVMADQWGVTDAR